MSETTKTLLIAGGVVVGAFVLMRVISPPAVPKGPPSATSSLAGVISSVAALGSGITNLFGHSTSGSSNPNAPSVPANFDTSNYSVSNGFMFTDANGNFIAG